MPPSQGAALPPPQGPRPRADEGHCRGDPGDRTQEPRASAGREGRVEKGWGGGVRSALNNAKTCFSG